MKDQITEAAKKIQRTNDTIVKIQDLIETEQAKADLLNRELPGLQAEIETQASDMALAGDASPKQVKALDVMRQALAGKINEADRATLAAKGLQNKLEEATQQRTELFRRYDELTEAAVLEEAERLGIEYLATAKKLFELFFRLSALDPIQKRTMYNRGQNDPRMCQSLGRWTTDCDMVIPSFDLKALEGQTDRGGKRGGFILKDCQIFQPFVHPEKLSPYVQEAKTQLGIVDFRRSPVRKVEPTQEISAIPDNMAGKVDQVDGLGLAPQMPTQTEAAPLPYPQKHFAKERPQMIESAFLRDSAASMRDLKAEIGQ